MVRAFPQIQGSKVPFYFWGLTRPLQRIFAHDGNKGRGKVYQEEKKRKKNSPHDVVREAIPAWQLVAGTGLLVSLSLSLLLVFLTTIFLEITIKFCGSLNWYRVGNPRYELNTTSEQRQRFLDRGLRIFVKIQDWSDCPCTIRTDADGANRPIQNKLLSTSWYSSSPPVASGL